MQAILLVGGKGQRLRPYTAVFPKSLMPVGDIPILEVVLRQLKRDGFHKIAMAVGHQHEMFRTFFGDGKKWNLDITYSLEDSPLGTAGPLKLVPDLDDCFLMMNGDILTDLDFRHLMEFHRAHGKMITIATHQRKVKIDYGTLDYGKDGFLKSYTEKPTLKYNVSMGIYIISRPAVDLIPPNRPFDFPDLINDILARETGQIVCYPYDGYWLDIGRPDDYEIAIDDFDRMKDKLLP